MPMQLEVVIGMEQSFTPSLHNGSLLDSVDLNPATPQHFVTDKKEAFSRELELYVVSKPLCLLRCFTPILDLNLGLFSSMSLVLANPDHPVEIRTQMQQGTEESSSMDSANWIYTSSRSQTTISRYAEYQITSFTEAQNESLESEGARTGDVDAKSTNTACKRKKLIKFGTNVDLSDVKKWQHQLDELNKLPNFARVTCDSNMLSYVGHTILGVNTVQLYMKVPGSRTPGHQENSNFCSVNVNVGPGDCEWFCVPNDYWTIIRDMCVERNVRYLTGSWWPNPKDLFDRNVPLYHFIQKPGDLVWIGPGTVHWVQALGWCNNIAWNVGPLTWLQYKVAIDRHDFYKEHHFRSIIPMIQLSWNLARNCGMMSDRWLVSLLSTFLHRSLNACAASLQCTAQFGKEVKWHGRVDGEPAHYCESCEVEVFNVLFTVPGAGHERKYFVHCMTCALGISPQLSKVVVLQQYQMPDLADIYNKLQPQ